MIAFPGDASIEDYWQFELDCGRLDVALCDTTKEEDKLRLIRAVRLY